MREMKKRFSFGHWLDKVRFDAMQTLLKKQKKDYWEEEGREIGETEIVYVRKKVKKK